MSLHRKYGVPASVQIAQWIQETGFNRDVLSKVSNNDFGVKCFGRGCNKGHCVNYEDDTPDDRFRVYRSKMASWKHHAELLAGKRYGRLLRHGNDYRKWCYGLQALGYATDQSYSNKLIQIIQKYRLYEFDSVSP